jgi:hypothetical protein
MLLCNVLRCSVFMPPHGMTVTGTDCTQMPGIGRTFSGYSSMITSSIRVACWNSQFRATHKFLRVHNCLDQRRHGSARTCSLHCTLTPAARLHAHACSLHCTLGAIRSGTRYAKWAGGSRSQTHRRAAMGGFTQDDGYVRGVAPTHSCCSESFSNC